MTMKKYFLRTFLIVFSILSSESVSQQKDQRYIETEHLSQALRLQYLKRNNGVVPSRFEQYKIDVNSRLSKSADIFTDAKYFLMNGNQIVGNIYDYGGIAPGDGLLRNINNMVWRKLGDIYQFAPFVASKVIGAQGDTITISSDAINDTQAKDFNPFDSQKIFGWRPLPEYVHPSSSVMASNPAPDLAPRDGKPDSWPQAWYNPSKGQYVWPGYLRQDVPNSDLEVLWGMDDRNNNEFSYFPIASDSSIRGLGIKMEARALQWSNSLAQNCIFFIYTAQNYSDKDLDSTYFGMYGDVDVGGASGSENQDDIGFFISPFDTITKGTGIPVPLYSRSLVYLWDADGKGYLNIPTHYNGCKFLESPGNANDGKDNDADGLTNALGVNKFDESQTDGFDNDHDWNPLYDDVGIDGVPNTQDEGESDGIPTSGKRKIDGTLDPLFPGEPHFELTDLDESDQIGLTAFKSWAWTTVKFRDDPVVWGILQGGFNDTIPNLTDINFMYGSGKISLKRKNTDGSIKRFSIALLMGTNLNDLLITARTVQVIYNQNYQFIRPPDKPIVSAVPSDKKVTLYWDNNAEQSVDPILGKDFEGYVIYRSTNPQFSDINTITDGFGSPILYEPLKQESGKIAKYDVAMRPEPYFEADTSSTKNGKYDVGEKFIDVNLNGLRDSTDVEDFYKGFSVIPYDQRGIAYYLGDNSGLMHSYVDSNNIINGQTYYYAVVSYDHGDITTYPPTECTKRINIDPITSQLVYDVNTVSVTPGPRVNGFLAPKFVSMDKIDHIKGTATGNLSLEIVDELSVKDNITYEIDFLDTLIQDNVKLAKLNYRILRVTPTTTDVFMFDTNNVKIGTLNILRDNFLKVTNTSTGQVYTEGIDYSLDTARGFIKKKSTGAMANISGPFTISFRFYPQPPSAYFSNEEANVVFDGMKIFVTNESLDRDTVRSRLIIDNKTISFKFLAPSIGSKRIAPLDIQLQFTNNDTDATGKYINPGDTLFSTTLQKKIVAPFRIKNITKDSALSLIAIEAICSEQGAIPLRNNNRWDWGEAIVLRTPVPFRVASNNTMYEVLLTPRNASNRNISGDVLNVLTSKPFTSSDKFTFTTKAAQFSPQLASTHMDQIKVVPNPYVAVNDIEPTDRLPGTTRGSRRIYFEHLPKECSIRIYTVSGELVKELSHSSGIDNGREYWDLLNRDNLGISYGVYIAHIEAKGIGEKILKFAVIK